MAGEKRRREPERASQKAESGLATLHRARVADWQPAPVAHLATSSDGSLAVAVRDDGNVDFYDLTGPHCSRVGERVWFSFVRCVKLWFILRFATP